MLEKIQINQSALFLHRILGAWWLGWIILGVITFFCAALIELFPKYLPQKKQESNINNYELEKMRG